MLARTDQNNAREAVARLMEEEGARMYAVALRITGNAADAQDLVQDAFLQAFRRWETFRGDASPATWLHTILARMARRRLKRFKGGSLRRMPAESQLAPWGESRVIDLTPGGTSPEGEAIRREAERGVRRAVARLPVHFRVALILKEMLELPVETVAEALGIKEETVKTRLHRARLLVRKEMLRGLPVHAAPDPLYERRVCMDLLRAKLDAMDRGREFPVGQKIICERCRLVFDELDLTHHACAELATGEFPGRLRRLILADMERESPRRGKAPTPVSAGRPARSDRARRPRSGRRYTPARRTS